MDRKELGLYLKIFRLFYPPVAPKTDLLTRLQQQREQKLSPQWRQYCCKKNKYTNLRSFIKRNSVLVWRVIIPTKPCRMKEAFILIWNKSKPFILETSGKTTHGDEGHFLKRYRHLGDEVEAFIHMKKIFLSNSRKNFCLTKAENHYGETIMISRFVS